jgi:hypothetical protein
LFDVPGLEVGCCCCSFPCNELKLLFTLVPGVGDEGEGFAVAPLTMPFRVGIWLEEELGVPSEERTSREALGSALGFGVLCFDLKRKLIFSARVEGGWWSERKLFEGCDWALRWRKGRRGGR